MMWSHIWQGPLTIIIWSIVTGLATWGALSLKRRGSPVRAACRTPRDIARERYARGEVTREEYERLTKSIM